MADMYSVIMAGGGGTRFWPLSRHNMPKQFLNLTGNDVMINETIDRYKDIISIRNTYIVTNQEQKEALKKVIHKEIPPPNILIEPTMKNTAPCILFAAMKIFKERGDGIMFVFPSDHYISDEKKFIQALIKSADIADKTGKLVTVGIKPTFPSTGYGYIQYNKNESDNAYEVTQFVEKPSLEKAKNYMESGDYLWNSGMFVWKISVIIENFKRYLPRLYNSMLVFQNAIGTIEEEEYLKTAYEKIQNISIDYGVLERSNDVLVVSGDFGWNDIGSWDSFKAVFPSDCMGNIVQADLVGIDTKESIIYGRGKLIAAIGLDNMIVVNSEDAILICPKSRAQEVRDIVDELKRQGRIELL